MNDNSFEYTGYADRARRRQARCLRAPSRGRRRSERLLGVGADHRERATRIRK
jgi:hypothetical protein